MSITEDRLRQIVREEILRMKSCMNTGHHGCEQCSPGFNDRMRHAHLNQPLADNWPISPVFGDPFR